MKIFTRTARAWEAETIFQTLIDRVEQYLRLNDLTISDVQFYQSSGGSELVTLTAIVP